MTRRVAPLPPGPRTPPLWQLLHYSHSPLKFLEGCARRYGDPFTVPWAGFGTSNPYRNWKWVGGFLWLSCYYDHCFEELTPAQTKLMWVVEANGFGESVIGPLFAKDYSKNLDRAIPLLVEEMNASRCSEAEPAAAPDVGGISSTGVLSTAPPSRVS